MDTIKENQEAVDVIMEEHSEDLDDWESGFIESIHTRLQNKQNLTEKQEASLNKIWRKCVG